MIDRKRYNSNCNLWFCTDCLSSVGKWLTAELGPDTDWDWEIFFSNLATFKWLLEKILSCDIVFFYWVGMCQTLLCTNDAAGQNWDRETAKLVFIISDHLDFPQGSAGQIEKLPFWLIQASPRNRIFCLDLLCNQPQLTRTDFMDHINGKN